MVGGNDGETLVGLLAGNVAPHLKPSIADGARDPQPHLKPIAVHHARFLVVPPVRNMVKTENEHWALYRFNCTLMLEYLLNLVSNYYNLTL